MRNYYMDQIKVNHLKWKPLKEYEPVLKDVNITFEEGEFYGIIGPNGSGKTSFVRHILRLLDCQTGEIQVKQRDIKDFSRKDLAKEIAFLPQSSNGTTDFSVYDIVAMGRNPYKSRFSVLNQQDKKMIEDAMESTNCSKLKDKKIMQISGGERQRVLIARAIAQDTPWIVLDEPISNLDIKHQVELMEALRKLNLEKRKTVITILHDLNLAATYCSKIVLLKNGQIAYSGCVEDVMTRENLKSVYEIDFQVIGKEVLGKKYYLPILRSEQE